MTSKQHKQIAAKLMEMASALAPNISNGPDFTKAFDRFFGVEGAYDMFVSDLYDALKARAA